MQLLYTRIERMMPFVSFYFFYFLLPCLINASVSVCVYNFHCFLPQQSDGLWCASSTQIDYPNNAEIHTYLLVCESTDFWMYSGSHQYEYVCGWRATLWSFFFVRFACVCVITCWSVVFASLLCVSICREESFALQLMGSIHSKLVFFRNQENK